MRTRTLKVAVLAYQAVLVYLFVTQNLAVTGVAHLPLSFFATPNLELFLVQTGLILMQLVGVFGMSRVNKKQREEQAQR